MATEARKFQLGMFIIAVTVIGIGGLIWLGASRFFERSEHLVTYLSETVQGLEPGSAVKYRGVPAGRVEAIAIAPDDHLIEVLMRVDPQFARLVRKDATLRAQIQLAGITGLRYVEIDHHEGDALQDSPELSFQPPYPVIRSTPSSFKAIQTALEEMYDQIMKMDLVGISRDVRTTLHSADTLLRDERIGSILTNLQEMSQSARQVTARLGQIAGDLELRPAVDNLNRATEEASKLFSDLHSGDAGIKLREALTAIRGVAESAQRFMVRLQYTMERIDRTVATMDRLTDEVRGQPSRLLFGGPPPLKRPGGGNAQ